MIITAKTKVSEVIKENKDSIDAIASLAKPLKKLKNPLLRKVMAGRVTLLEASKMGGVSFEDFVKILEPLGFQYDTQSSDNVEETIPEPNWLTGLKEDQISNFDVRSIIENNGDPLKAIMDHFKPVTEGNALCVINSFEPVPLINRLTKKDTVKAFTRQVGPAEYHTFFFKAPGSSTQSSGGQASAGANSGNAGTVFKDTQEVFEALCTQWEGEKRKTIDVRDLEMPLPRMTILEELDHLPNGVALYVFHKKVPIYLLEDLAEMEFEVHLTDLEPGNVRLLLFKAA